MNKKAREEMRLPDNPGELGYLYSYMPETVLWIKIFAFWRKIGLLGNPGALAYLLWFIIISTVIIVYLLLCLGFFYTVKT